MTLKARLGVVIMAVVAGGVLISACGTADSDTAKSAAKTKSAQDNFVDRLSSAYRKQGSVAITMKVNADSFTVAGDGEVEFGESAKDDRVAMTLKKSGDDPMNMDIRVIGTDLYAQTPDSAGKFVNVDLEKNTDSEWDGIKNYFDLDRRFGMLIESAEDFTKAGDTKKIHGTNTQPYRLTVDPSKLADTDALFEYQILKDASGEVTYTVFVDSQDVVHRIKLKAGGDDFVMNFTDWEDPVNIKKPKPSKVISP